MSKFIDSISIENYRGIKEKQTIYLADKGNMTFLVGQNNAGKTLISKVLLTLDRISVNENTRIPEISLYNMTIGDSEFYNCEPNNPIILTIGLNKTITAYIDKWIKENASYNSVFNILQRFKEIYLIVKLTKVVGQYKIHSFLSDGNIDTYIYDHTDNLYLLNDSVGAFHGYKIADVETVTKKIIATINSSFLIFSPIRSFHHTNTTYNTGYDLLNFFNSKGDDSEKMILKNKVGKYLINLNLEKPNHVSVVKDNNQQLSFTFKDNLELTSDDVGTGYTMIYVLIAEIFRNEKRTIIIDEIESHLHPGLIRELIKILREIGKEQQFIIATHSPTVMESANEKDHLYHFQKIDNRCTINKFYKGSDSSNSLRTVGNDMGIIPGDALLSNCVIWVEGPSEILWLRAWMKTYLPIHLKEKKKDTNILEGLHYSILMTGGSLISNIYFEEDNKPLDDIEENFGLKVLRINPNPFVIIDSDNSSFDFEKFKRCLRIATELNEQNKMSNLIKIVSEPVSEANIHEVTNLWLLKGRELENYCHPEILRDFYLEKSKHKNSKIAGVENVSIWDVYSSSIGVVKLLEDQGLIGIKSNDSNTMRHKMSLASYVFQNFNEVHFQENPKGIIAPNTEMLNDLKENLGKLFEYIFTVNSLS